MGADKPILRKILVMAFDDYYLKCIGEIITKKRIQLYEETGYLNFENQNKNLIYTLLSSQIKRKWYHHYSGTYGIIIVNEGSNISENMEEIFNVINSNILKKRPLLLVYDKNKIFEKDNKYLENLRFSLSKKQIIYNVIYVDFKENKKNSELLYGLDWLYKQILKII